MQNIETLLGLDGASSQKKLLLGKNTVSLNPFMVENEAMKFLVMSFKNSLSYIGYNGFYWGVVIMENVS